MYGVAHRCVEAGLATMEAIASAGMSKQAVGVVLAVAEVLAVR